MVRSQICFEDDAGYPGPGKKNALDKLFDCLKRIIGDADVVVRAFIALLYVAGNRVMFVSHDGCFYYPNCVETRGDIGGSTLLLFMTKEIEKE